MDERLPPPGPLGPDDRFRLLEHDEDCPLIPGRQARFQARVVPGRMAWVGELFARGFRRQGVFIYRPICPSCRACRALRVSVAGFRPRRDQRRIWARNRDLRVSWVPRGRWDGERSDLWFRYHAAVHGEEGDEAMASALNHIADDLVSGGDLEARSADGRLLAVAICDVVPGAWSSVYCYWEPGERRRGLGAFMALAEIAAARERGIPWWYPGLWNAECPKLAYKARYQPAELLGDDGVWRPFGAP